MFRHGIGASIGASGSAIPSSAAVRIFFSHALGAKPGQFFRVFLAVSLFLFEELIVFLLRGPKLRLRFRPNLFQEIGPPCSVKIGTMSARGAQTLKLPNRKTQRSAIVRCGRVIFRHRRDRSGPASLPACRDRRSLSVGGQPYPCKCPVNPRRRRMIFSPGRQSEFPPLLPARRSPLKTIGGGLRSPPTIAIQ